MEFETILYEKKDNVAWITFNRPKVLNAQNQTLMAEVMAALEDAKVRAQLMAEGLGITLGKPILVTEGGFSVPFDIGLGMGGGGGMAESAAVSISPGAFSVSVSVQVVYEIQ